jgi:hypothetical protein
LVVEGRFWGWGFFGLLRRWLRAVGLNVVVEGVMSCDVVEISSGGNGGGGGIDE